jgi:hypothetical protein
MHSMTRGWQTLLKELYITRGIKRYSNAPHHTVHRYNKEPYVSHNDARDAQIAGGGQA